MNIDFWLAQEDMKKANGFFDDEEQEELSEIEKEEEEELLYQAMQDYKLEEGE